MNNKQDHEYLVPIEQYIKQQMQIASNQEWDGDLEGCDKTLEHLRQVREYQEQTGSAYYPLF